MARKKVIYCHCLFTCASIEMILNFIQVLIIWLRCFTKVLKNFSLKSKCLKVTGSLWGVLNKSYTFKSYVFHMQLNVLILTMFYLQNIYCSELCSFIMFR